MRQLLTNGSLDRLGFLSPPPQNLTTRPRATLALFAAIALAGCGGSDTAGAPDAGPGGFHPPPVPAACAAPTVAPGASITPATGQHLVSPRLAWDGTQAVVAYAESTASGQFTVKLQRLTGAGQIAGDPVELGPSASTFGLHVALATDGTVDLVCWEETSSQGIRCASAPAAGSGAATAGATIASASLPSLSYGEGGFVLAYAGTGGAELQALDASGQVHGAVVAAGSGATTALAVVARSSGYAAIVGGDGGLAMRRFDKALAPAGDPITLAASFSATDVAAAASGDEVVAVWGEQLQVSEVTVAADGSVRPLAAVAPENIYSQVGAARAAGSFVTTWSSEGGHIGYRAIDGAGAPMGTPQTALAVNWDDNQHDISGVADGFLVVSTVSSGGDSLALAHLACP
jgi:hypothetical protein